MTTGEAKRSQGKVETEIQAATEVEVIEKTDIIFSVNDNSASKFKVKERFSRLKKSLRKRSVSIL